MRAADGRWAFALALFTAGCVESPNLGVVALVPFALPIADPTAIDDVVGVDHDPVDHPPPLGDVLCADYLGRPFPHCYDEHDGSDFLLAGGFEAMDAGSVDVVAAADGVVTDVHDGEYDRCHGTADGVDCDGHPRVANRVTMQHAYGLVTDYLHLMRGSVRVLPGDVVRCGDLLGTVGSSGNSSMPHLHFEVTGREGVVLDPYVDPASDLPSGWREQGDEDGLPSADCAR